MTRNMLSTWGDFTPFTIGFNSIFNELDRVRSLPTTNYPPYNIKRLNDNNYKIEVALAGFDKKDIEVELKEKTLTIRNKVKKETIDEDGNGVIHKGISTRQFQRSFTISEDIKVKDGELKNGLLSIDLERIIPENKKPHLIEIR